MSRTIQERRDALVQKKPDHLDNLLDDIRELAARVLSAESIESNEQFALEIESAKGLELAERIQQLDERLTRSRVHFIPEGVKRLPADWQF
jgi:CRISPR/Cas system-associated protein Csm6